MDPDLVTPGPPWLPVEVHGSVGSTKSVSLPPQPVARNGMISVPYVGVVKAAGLTPAQVQKSIETALHEKAIEPQVIVTLTNSASNAAPRAALRRCRMGSFPFPCAPRDGCLGSSARRR